MITVSDIYKYYHCVLSALNQLVSEDMKLTEGELIFLSYCYVYNHEKGNLSNFDELADFLIEKKAAKNKSNVSTRKLAIGSKKWAKTGRYIFKLNDSIERQPFVIRYDKNKAK